MTYSKSNQLCNGFLVAAESCKDRPPLQERFIDYPFMGVPDKWRGSTLTWEQVNEIVSAYSESVRVVLREQETCSVLTTLGEQNHGHYNKSY